MNRRAGESGPARQHLRITHLIDTLQVGGAEAMLASLARRQRETGHDVRVLCLLSGGPFEEKLLAAGVDVSVCRHNPLQTSLPGKLRTVAELRREVRAWRTDILHCHNVTTALYGAPAGRMARAGAILCTRHGFYVPAALVRKERAFWSVVRFCCDRVVAVSEAVRKGIAGLPYALPDRVVTIHNGISRPEVTRPPSERPGFTLVTVARLHPPKDHPTLLRAIAMVAGRIPGLHLFVVGGGQMEQQLREQARELGIDHCVEFLGNRPDVGNWLARSDVFVLASTSEGLPISVLEAMAAGLPMILSDVGGIGEAVRDLPAARLVPPARAQEMADAILDFYSRRDELKLLARRNHDRFEEHYSADRMASSYERLYRELLKA